jgi:hypothetical protein
VDSFLSQMGQKTVPDFLGLQVAGGAECAICCQPPK